MVSKGRAARVGARAMVTAAATRAMLPLMGIAATVIKHGSTVNYSSSNDHHYSSSNSTLSLEAPFGWSGVSE